MGGVFMFAMMAVFFGVAVVHGQQQNARRREVFARFARQHEGRLLPESSFGYKRRGVVLDYYGRRLEVRQTSTGGKHPVYYAEAELDIAGLNRAGTRIEIYPEAFFSSLGKLLGMQDIEIGVPVFDQRYILKCNQPHMLTAFLDSDTRGKVEDLYHLYGNRDIYVHVEAARLLVKKRGRIEDGAMLQNFYGRVLPLIDSVLRTFDATGLLAPTPGAAGIRFLPGTSVGADGGVRYLDTGSRRVPSPPAPVRAPRGTGITFVGGGHGPAEMQFLPDREGIYFEGEDEPAPPPTTCPVCGEGLIGRVAVACVDCDGRSHHDCWEFSGGCATYGCSSDRYTEA